MPNTTFISVIIGRTALSFVLGDVVIHELYTAAAGFYIIWLVLRILTVIKSWYPVGLNSFYQKSKVVFLVVCYIDGDDHKHTHFAKVVDNLSSRLSTVTQD